ncbi:MAG: type II toxin-antitoxin system RelE/ParE family toxin [Desulfovibrio sp.]|jgi:putative addiction module killer protein|nr:type II toxin-antitoxin system RelE/ParE family toxin [Desulfovibrio sp.]
MNVIRHYIDASGHDLFAEWRARIRDAQARIAVDRRIMRVELGNFGDHKYLRDGVWELRIDVGQGYRVYFAKTGLAVVLLLCGGDKRKQNEDVARSCECWREWKRANGLEDDL